MLAAGYSTKVAEKDQQGVSAFENFADRDLFAFGGGEGKGGGGGVEFHGSSSRWDEWKVVSGEWSCFTFYFLFSM